MQQMLSCPSCGSPVKPDQQFCGICGTKLSPVPAQSSQMNCPSCGSPVSSEQQFCGICGTKIADAVSTPVAPPPPPPPSQPAASPSMPARNMPVTNMEKPAAAAQPKKEVQISRKISAMPKLNFIYFGGVVFVVLGWLVLVLGSLLSIAYIVLGAMGGGFQLLFIGTGDITGLTAILLGIAGLIVSLVTGLQFLIISRLCYSFIDLTKKVYQ